MNIALGYTWYLTTTATHLHRAFQNLGHQVVFVGPGGPELSGYDSRASIAEITAHLSPVPDMYVWVETPGRYFPPGLEHLSIPSACYLIDVHLGSWRIEVARFFDAVFVAQKNQLEAYQQALGHKQVYWLPLAAAPETHRRLELTRCYEIGFVGNTGPAHNTTARRRRLELLSRNFHTNDFFRWYNPSQLSEIYSQSLIAFNNSLNHDVNMRVFEGISCGAMMLTDAPPPGLDELFDIGKELITYTDDSDLIAKIHYYLMNNNERAGIAEAGYQRVMRDHTYTHRAQTILDVIRSQHFGLSAPMRTADNLKRLTTRRAIYTRLQMLDAILDDERVAGHNPLNRLLAVLPALLRRILR